MATRSAQQEPEKAEIIEEALDALDTTLDRVKVLYEQYFLGIQKQPPTYLHTDIERKLRDLAQAQIRNTALRYRFATLQQKFGSYNSYWRRTLRQIDNGTYTRNLFKIGRQAARTGAAVPPEILAAMPKRMREQVMRDREAALALARLREKPQGDELELLTLADDDVEIDVEDLDLEAAVIEESTEVRLGALSAGGAHRIDESDADFDLDAFFAAVTNENGPDIDLPPSSDPARRRRSSAMPVVGRAPTLRTEPRPPVEGPRAGHPRPGTLSGSPVAAQSEDLRLPGGSTRRSGKTPPGRRSSGPVPTDRGQAARSSPRAGETPARRADVPAEETASARRRAATSRSPSKFTSTQVMPEPTRTPSSPTRTATQEPTKPGIPPPLPPQATRSIPVVTGTATPPGSRAAPAPAATRAPAPPQTTRSIQVAPGSAAQGPAPSQATRSIPIIPGSAAAQPPAPVETLAGPFPRIPGIPSLPSNLRGGNAAPPSRPIPSIKERIAVPTIIGSGESSEPTATGRDDRDEPTDVMSAAAVPQAPERSASTPRAPLRPPPLRERPTPAERREPEPRQTPPPGMSDADVNALYAKYVKAKELLGEEAGPGAYGKLLKTINAQAPKIMEQYKAKGVDFSIVVKDNQVIIRAKPKP